MTSFSEEKEAAAILKTSDLLSRDCAFWAPAFHGKHRLLHGFTDQWPTSAFQGYLLSPDVQSWALPGPWASASHCSEQTSHLTQPSWKIKAWFFWAQAIKVLLTKPRLCCSTLLQKQSWERLSYTGAWWQIQISNTHKLLYREQRQAAGEKEAATRQCNLKIGTNCRFQLPKAGFRFQSSPSLLFPAPCKFGKGVMLGKNGSQSTVLQRQSCNFYELTYKTIHWARDWKISNFFSKQEMALEEKFLI